jgi:outer membrane protein
VKKIIFLIAVSVLVSTVSTAQTIKIAYVNSDKILQELPEYVQVKKEIEASVKSWQDTLQEMNKQFNDALEDYNKKEALLDAKAKSEKQRDLQELQQKMRDYQYVKFDQRDGEVAKLRDEKFGPIQKKVMRVIEKVAKQGKYNYVFDKLETATNILYADQKLDITYKVIDELKTK